MPSRVLILGGAGFLGSHIAERFLDEGWHVSILDGMLPRTGGGTRNVTQISGKIEMHGCRIEACDSLGELIESADLVVDAMAWTAHLLAIDDPAYDIELNICSHLPVLRALRDNGNRPVIFLGSRGQYGNPVGLEITEESPMVPLDIQGINKLAAESYYRVYASLSKLSVLSLRLPNCFGERQPTEGNDIGLVGSFIRDALEGATIEVFGNSRSRTIAYASDIADIVVKCSTLPLESFRAYNVPGQHIMIADLATKVVQLAGTGACVVKPLPPAMHAIDSGSTPVSSAALIARLGPLPLTPLETSLKRTLEYFRERRTE